MSKSSQQEVVDRCSLLRFNRVKSLSNVLRDVEDVVPQRELTNQQRTELDGIVKGCCNVLKQLEKALDRYQELDSSPKSLGGKSRKVWKRFTWDQNDIDEFRSQITSNIMLFNTFLGRLTW